MSECEPLHYADYAVWQRRTMQSAGSAYRDDMLWWRDQLHDAPRALGLPCRRPAPLPSASASEGLLWWGIEPGITASLDRLAREEGTTFYVVRLAAFAALLSARVRERDIVFGTYFTNRNRIELQRMFGFFSNLVTLRLAIEPHWTFRQCIAAVRERVSEVQAMSEVPYEHVRTSLRAMDIEMPEIQAIFATAEHNQPLRFGGIELSWLERRMENMPWGFTVSFNQHREHDRCRCDFDARMHDPALVRDLIAQLARMLGAASRQSEATLSALLS
jgi:non-ribosomal peptide synthetase component F